MLVSSRLGLVAGLTALALAACTDSRLRSVTESGTPVEPAGRSASGDRIGTGPVTVALILPLTGPGQGASAARALRNAAELSMAEFQGGDLTILVKDDRGTAEGAREAAGEALAEGAQLILGPLFAPAVAAAGQAARGAGKPVIAFSTDSSVASRGVYLLSFLPQPEVDRVLDHAAKSGRRSVAALIPETAYGHVVEAQFQEAATRRGLRIAAVERYPAGQAGPAVQRLAGVIGGEAPQADALFLPDSGEGLAAVASALEGAGFDPARVKPLGTGVWADPRTRGLAALQGGWYAAPDTAGYAAFSGRYRAKFGSDPIRIATLSYDAVSLAASLARKGTTTFTESVIENPAGFSGSDGPFRFKSDGTSDRSLAILELRSSGPSVVSPAPRSL